MIRFPLFVKLLLGLLFAVIPLLGHLACTVMIVREKRRFVQKALWIIVVWIVPLLGPLLYLLIGSLLCHRFRFSPYGWLIPCFILVVLICSMVMSFFH